MRRPYDQRRRHLGYLSRRRDYLRNLLAKEEGNSWDVSEEAALTWAIDLLEAHLNITADPLGKEPVVAGEVEA